MSRQAYFHMRMDLQATHIYNFSANVKVVLSCYRSAKKIYLDHNSIMISEIQQNWLKLSTNVLQIFLFICTTSCSVLLN